MISLNGIFMGGQEASPLLSIKTPVKEVMNAVKEILSSRESVKNEI